MSEPFYCTICADSDESETNPIVTLECGHSFHTHCLITWFRKHHDTCPNCRSTRANCTAVRLTPPQRVKRMMKMRKHLPGDVGQRLKAYETVAHRSKTLRRTLRTFRKEHGHILKAYSLMHTQLQRSSDKEDVLFTTLSRTVVPGVPLLDFSEPYDSEFESLSEEDDNGPVQFV